MPIYEYICNECNHVEEILQKFGDDAPLICDKCKKNHTLTKLVSNSSFQLKGGGWYKDLYSSTKKVDNTPKTTATSSCQGACSHKSH